MAQILVEESALDSLKEMAQRLQDERDELLSALKVAVDRQAYREGSGPKWWENARAAIAKCTQEQ